MGREKRAGVMRANAGRPQTSPTYSARVTGGKHRPSSQA